MERQYSHTFISKSFYKQFHKCTKCNKRNLWNPIVKCSGCRTYCHQRCIQPDDDVCCRPDRNAADFGLADTAVAVVEKHKEDIVSVSCADKFKLTEQRPYAMVGNLDTATEMQDLIPELVYNERVSEVDQIAEGLRPTSDGIMYEERSSNTTTLPNEETLAADELVSSPAFHQSAKHISEEALEEDQRFRHRFATKPIYKWVHKCTECQKRTFLNPIAKCRGCYAYYHRKCIQPDVHIYCTRDDESGLLSILDSDEWVIEENPEKIVHGSSAEISKLSDQRSYAVNSNFNTGMGLQDQIFVPVYDELMSKVDENAKSAKPTFDGITSKECNTSITTLENGEALVADKHRSLPSIHQSVEHNLVGQRFRHNFVNKPIYKWLRKCADCGKRKIWNPIAKCSGCKTYCHRMCIQLDDEVCCRPNCPESTLQVMDLEQDTVVAGLESDNQDKIMAITRLNEDLHDSELVTSPDENDLKSADSHIVVVDGHLDGVANNTCVENLKFAEQRPNAMDGNLDTGKRLQDLTEGIIDEKSVPEVGQNTEDTRQASDAITSDKCYTTTLANEDAQAADGHRSSSSTQRSVGHISEYCWMNMEFPRSCWPTRSLLTNTMLIEDSSESDPTSYRLPSLGIETDKRQKEDDSVHENDTDTCCDDGNLEETNEEESWTMTLISQCIITLLIVLILQIINIVFE